MSNSSLIIKMLAIPASYIAILALTQNSYLYLGIFLIILTIIALIIIFSDSVFEDKIALMINRYELLLDDDYRQFYLDIKFKPEKCNVYISKEMLKQFKNTDIKYTVNLIVDKNRRDFDYGFKPKPKTIVNVDEFFEY